MSSCDPTGHRTSARPSCSPPATASARCPTQCPQGAVAGARSPGHQGSPADARTRPWRTPTSRPNVLVLRGPAGAPAVDLDAAQPSSTRIGRSTPTRGYRFKNLNGIETYYCINDPAASPHTAADADTCPEAERAPVKDEDEYDLRIEACTTTSQTRQDLLAMVSGMLNKVGVQVVISPVAGRPTSSAPGTSANDQTPCNLAARQLRPGPARVHRVARPGRRTTCTTRRSSSPTARTTRRSSSRRPGHVPGQAQGHRRPPDRSSR